MVSVPFREFNESLGFSVGIPYLPHRDPCNSEYRPVPNPAEDPYFIPELTDPSYRMMKPVEMLLTEATVPSAGSNRHDASTQAAWAEKLESNKKLDNVLFDSDGHVSGGLLQPNTNCIVHVDDFESAPSLARFLIPRAPHLSNIRDCTDGTVTNWDQRQQREQKHQAIQTINEEPEKEQLSELEARSDMEDLSIADSIAESAAKNVEAASVEVAAPASGDRMAELENISDLSGPRSDLMKHTNTGIEDEDLVDCCALCDKLNRETLDALTLYGGEIIDYQDVLKKFRVRSEVLEVREHAMRASVAALYESWGLSPRDAAFDVSTGFHRLGNNSCRSAGVCPTPRRSRARIELSLCPDSNFKIALYLDDSPVWLVSASDDTLIKEFKNMLWILYNAGNPLDVTLVDNTGLKSLPEGKYYWAVTTPDKLLKGLVEAWGATFTFPKSKRARARARICILS